jgi:hypothetical protein
LDTGARELVDLYGRRSIPRYVVGWWLVLCTKRKQNLKWLIVFAMMEADPFAVKSLQFDTQNECKAYINDPVNSDRLAIEVIDVAGFNDTIVNVACMPANKITKEVLNETESKV